LDLRGRLSRRAPRSRAQVRLPDVEFLINMWDHPKVPQQNMEPVFAMSAAAAAITTTTPTS
jgi:hypothetical protein